MGRQPWMPPSPQDILNDALSGHSGLPGYSGPLVHDPLAPWRGYPDPSSNPRIQPGAPSPISLQGMPFDPKLSGPVQTPLGLKDPERIDPKSFEPIHMSSSLKVLERKHPAQNGGTAPLWQFAAGIFVLAFVAGLLHALFRREANAV
jgi:hypothetical protein